MSIHTLQDSYLNHMDTVMPGGEEGFVITDESAANWAVRKIAQARANMERRMEFFNAEVERLSEWLESENKRDQDTIDYMTSLLRPYFDTLRESGALGKRKSYRLPCGILQIRKSKPKWRRDNDTLTEWAKERGLVRNKIEPAWSDISKNLRPQSEHIGAPAMYLDPESGEMVEVPGVKLEVPAQDEFSVKLEGE